MIFLTIRLILQKILMSKHEYGQRIIKWQDGQRSHQTCRQGKENLQYSIIFVIFAAAFRNMPYASKVKI